MTRTGKAMFVISAIYLLSGIPGLSQSDGVILYLFGLVALSVATVLLKWQKYSFSRVCLILALLPPCFTLFSGELQMDPTLRVETEVDISYPTLFHVPLTWIDTVLVDNRPYTVSAAGFDLLPVALLLSFVFTTRVSRRADKPKQDNTNKTNGEYVA